MLLLIFCMIDELRNVCCALCLVLSVFKHPGNFPRLQRKAVTISALNVKETS